MLGSGFEGCWVLGVFELLGHVAFVRAFKFSAQLRFRVILILWEGWVTS